MKPGVFKRVGIVLIAGAMLVATTGCNELLYGTNAVSVVASWVLSSTFTANNVERQCFENGVQIDCANLPAELGQ